MTSPIYERIEIVSENKPIKVKFILGEKLKKGIISSTVLGTNIVLKHKEIETINRKKKKVEKFIGCPL